MTNTFFVCFYSFIVCVVVRVYSAMIYSLLENSFIFTWKLIKLSVFGENVWIALVPIVDELSQHDIYNIAIGNVYVVLLRVI